MTMTEQWCDEMERLRAEATSGEWTVVCNSCNSVVVVDSYGQVVVEKISDDDDLPDTAPLAHIVAMHNSQEVLLRVVLAAEDFESKVGCMMRFLSEKGIFLEFGELLTQVDPAKFAGEKLRTTLDALPTEADDE